MKLTPEKELSLFLLIPFTIGILMFIISNLLWAFGNSCLITNYYTSRFNGPLEANLWVINQLGFIGTSIVIIWLICYFYLTLQLFKK